MELLRGDVVRLAHQLREDGDALRRGAEADSGEQRRSPAVCSPLGHGAILASVITRIILICRSGRAARVAAVAGSEASAARRASSPPSIRSRSRPSEVGGDDVEVTNLTPAGAEPHDLELTPRRRGDPSAPTSSSTWATGSSRPLEEAVSGARRQALDLLEGLELRDDEGRPARLARSEAVRARSSSGSARSWATRPAPRQLVTRLRALDEDYEPGSPTASGARSSPATTHSAISPSDTSSRSDPDRGPRARGGAEPPRPGARGRPGARARGDHGFRRAARSRPRSARRWRARRAPRPQC